MLVGGGGGGQCEKKGGLVRRIVGSFMGRSGELHEKKGGCVRREVRRERGEKKGRRAHVSRRWVTFSL